MSYIIFLSPSRLTRAFADWHVRMCHALPQCIPRTHHRIHDGRHTAAHRRNWDHGHGYALRYRRMAWVRVRGQTLLILPFDLAADALVNLRMFALTIRYGERMRAWVDIGYSTMRDN